MLRLKKVSGRKGSDMSILPFSGILSSGIIANKSISDSIGRKNYCKYNILQK
jgi:hypothetical protein